MNVFNRNLVKSIGPGPATAYFDAYFTGNSSLLGEIRSTFTPTELVSSAWEYMTWLAAVDQLLGNPDRFEILDRIDETEEFYQLLAGRDVGPELTGYADGFLISFRLELEGDFEESGPAVEGPVDQDRQMFRTYPLVHDPRMSGLSHEDCVVADHDAELGEFPAWVEPTTHDIVDGAALAAIAMTLVLAADNNVEIADMVAIVAAIAIEKAANTDAKEPDGGREMGFGVTRHLL